MILFQIFSHLGGLIFSTYWNFSTKLELFSYIASRDNSIEKEAEMKSL